MPLVLSTSVLVTFVTGDCLFTAYDSCNLCLSVILVISVSWDFLGTLLSRVADELQPGSVLEGTTLEGGLKEIGTILTGQNKWLNNFLSTLTWLCACLAWSPDSFITKAILTVYYSCYYVVTVTVTLSITIHQGLLIAPYPALQSCYKPQRHTTSMFTNHKDKSIWTTSSTLCWTLVSLIVAGFCWTWCHHESPILWQ
jgi:hypothetical protein